MNTALSVGGAFLQAGQRATPAFWWSVGIIAVSNLLSSKEQVHGPRLENLAIQNSAPGYAIPVIAGKARTAGNIIWSQRIQEHTQDVSGGGGGGKGPVLSGPSATQYTYTWSGAVLVCEGPVNMVPKIWGDNKLFYDYNDGDQQGYDPTNGLAPFALTQDPTTNTWGNANIRIYTGTENQLPDSLIEAIEGAGNVPANRGNVVVVFEDISLETWNMALPTWTFLVDNPNITSVGAAIKNLNARVGLSDEEFDAGPLDDITFDGTVADGMIFQQRQQEREHLEMLQRVYNVRFCEYDYKINTVPLWGEEPVVTFDENDIAFVKQDDSIFNVTANITQDREIPQRVEVEHIDKVQEYNRNMQFYQRQVVDSDKRVSFSIPIVCSAAEARRVAQANCFAGWTERESFSIQVGVRHSYLTPGDKIVVPTKTGNILCRIENMVKQLFGPCIISCVKTIPGIYQQPSLGNPQVPNNPSTLPSYPTPRYYMEDLVTLRDEDSENPGYYFAATSELNKPFGGVTIIGQGLIIQPNGGNLGATIGRIGTIGTVPSCLDDWTGDGSHWDYDSTMVVDLENGSLASATEEDIYTSTANSAAVGGEIIRFLNATFIGVVSNKNRYQVDGFLRVQKGSEYAGSGHAPGELFCLLDNGVTRIAMGPASLEIPKDFSILWGPLGFGGYTNVNKTCHGISMKPLMSEYLADYSVRDVMTDDIHFEWEKSSRHADTFFVTGQPPTDSSYDLYKFEIDVYDGADVIKTYTVTAEQWDYSAAQQTTDGLTPGDPVKIAVYRMSSLVGRGWPAIVTVS